MSTTQIDAKLLAQMFLSGAADLENNKEWINELNVFPVPDGDTGTNMTMTIMSAAREVESLGDEPSMAALCKAISSGSLRGARGNSGVILSQLFRGFCKAIKEEEVISIPLIAAACTKGVDTAYKAVMKPKEGTILTVARGIADKAQELSDAGAEDLGQFLRDVLDYGKYVLSQTPEMLPVLKQAGVVDSGGQGLIQVIEGAILAFEGKPVTISTEAGASKDGNGPDTAVQSEEIKFGYCTEFIILLENTFNVKNEMDFKAYLETIGDSIVCVADDSVVKVHVHTNDPGLAIQKALKYGQLSNLKIDNMRLENKEKLEKQASKEAGNGAEVKTDRPEAAPTAKKTFDEPAKPYGFIAVSVGDGMNEIFESLGADYIISGGQTMNPSTADFLDAVDQVNAETIFVLPNNKNIVLAANQAAELTTDKQLLVIPTKTAPQGITALINFQADLAPEENEQTMMEEIKRVKTGQVTYAVRDTVIDDHEITKDDYMGIGDSGILANGKDMTQVILDMVSKMVDDESELISIYYGSDINEEQAEEIRSKIEEANSSCDIELQSGGQPIYYFIISVE